jgi:serine/threonine protein kinase
MTLVNASSCPQLLRYHGSHVYGTKLWIMMEFVDGGSVFDRIRRLPLV